MVKVRLSYFLAMSLTLGFASPALSENKACKVTNIEYTELTQLNLAELSVDLNCSVNEGDMVPVDVDLVAGLTVYGKSWGTKGVDLEGEAQELARLDGDVERRVILDPDTRHHDFALQSFRVTEQSKIVNFTFESAIRPVAEKPFMLFAIWHASSQVKCDPANRYERQGCKDYGYVVGRDLESALVLAYPGSISNSIYAKLMTPELLESGYVNRYWVVERYK